jgi:polyphosphate glucokinase
MNDSDGSSRLGLGIDIGGTGMKAGVVDLSTGQLAADRFRIDTPKPATPQAMAVVVRQLVDHFEWGAPAGVGFPAVVRKGVVQSAANIDKSWIDVDADALFTEAAGVDVHMINDADAAGVAEVRFGAGRGRSGVVMMLTFGTGIGSGLFIDGVLVPNTELGHLELDGHDAESRAAASARKRDDLSWSAWAKRVQRYLQHVEQLFSPDLFIAGGGASKQSDQWMPLLEIDTEIVPAQMANNAGIVGAALMAPDA